MGVNKTFDELLSSKDISGILSILDNNSENALSNIKKYNVNTHNINDREDKILTNEKGERIGIKIHQ